MSEFLAAVGSIVTATTVLLAAVYGCRRLVHSGRLRPGLAAVVVAIAASALPWISALFGQPWDFSYAVAFSLLMFVLFTIGVVGAFRGIQPSRDIPAR